MKQLLSFCLALMLGLTLPFAALAYAPDLQSPSDTVLGDARFDAYIPLLEGKRVALFSNHSGIVGDMTSGTGDAAGMDPSLIPFGRDSGGNEIKYGEHVLDAMLAHGVNVTAIFSPEHGFRGTASAGEAVSDSVDPATGVPILSLYAENSHYPSAESMDAFDVLVIDLQDVGLRYYTYYISMYYLMDACAAAGKPVVLLDRPNPNGFYVDGPILQEEFKSGVGRLPVPIVHGLTLGELARMINGEGWLEAGKDACDLTVIPCLNYTHGDRVPLVRAPSPNLKDMRAVYLYASTCFFENTAVSVGRGTDHPFEVYDCWTGQLQGYACGKVLRAELFAHVCFPEGYLFEDTLMTLILFPRCHRIVTIPDDVYVYRFNPVGITATAGLSPRAVESLLVTIQLMEDGVATGQQTDQQAYENFLQNEIPNTFCTLYSLRSPSVNHHVFAIFCRLLRQYYQT